MKWKTTLNWHIVHDSSELSSHFGTADLVTIDDDAGCDDNLSCRYLVPKGVEISRNTRTRMAVDYPNNKVKWDSKNVADHQLR